jgi:hypothetical protein
MAETVYVLCALASLAAFVLLVNGYRRSRSRLLLWASICFALLVVNNVLLFVDKVVVTDVDLSLARGLTLLAGVGTLLAGLIWDTR